MRQVEEAINTFGLTDLPICHICRLTEERARCDISKSEKQKCGLTLCRKCQQNNPERQCQQFSTGCKKRVKDHRFKNLIKDKLKNYIGYRFENESKFRSKLKVQNKYSEIDEDMTHILSALLGESTLVFNSTYKKELERLVEDLKKIKNTIQSQIQRGNLPVFKQEVFSAKPEEDNGVQACGYVVNDYGKGLNQILRSFY